MHFVSTYKFIKLEYVEFTWVKISFEVFVACLEVSQLLPVFNGA